jgi:hypothetical protein
MKTYEVWQEGYSATSESSKASFLGKYEANSFKEAIALCEKDNDIKITFQESDNTFRKWGCIIYDNETDARKRFG